MYVPFPSQSGHARPRNTPRAVWRGLPWAALCAGLCLPSAAARPDMKAAARAKPNWLQVPAGVGFDADLTYCTVKDCNLKLNVAYPKGGKGPFPAVVLIHGGGWIIGDHYDFARFSVRLAEKGYVAVTVTYRMLPKFRFPDQVHDVKAAVRWLRAKKKYNVDKERVGVLGHSAGGYLACMLGMTNGKDGLEGNGGFLKQRSDVCCVIGTSALTDLANLQARPAPALGVMVTKLAVQKFLGGPPGKDGKRYEAASPITYASRACPPTLLICGSSDTIVPNEQSLRLEKKLREAGADVRLVTLVNAPHDFLGRDLQRAEELCLEFLDRHVKNGRPKR
jgi:acetyl esterase/lipase